MKIFGTYLKIINLLSSQGLSFARQSIILYHNRNHEDIVRLWFTNQSHYAFITSKLWYKMMDNLMELNETVIGTALKPF